MDEKEIKQFEKLFGERIKFLRKRAGYKLQKDFARVFTNSDSKTSLLSRIEKGANIEFRTIIKLAQSLNISLVSIFDFHNSLPILKGTGFKIPLEKLLQRELISLGKRIKVIRNIKGKIQLDIDVTASIDRSNLSDYEKGIANITFDTIIIIANALEVKAWELFDYKGKF
ncbi:helix-turn-helix domain-containing protein [Parafilimonas sp.]|uniref:helix-turn-helix domain-containing protein n=1 Tax=Parafilimonas sp. TaxID=1969739 RepID=UPI0039E2DB2F